MSQINSTLEVMMLLQQYLLVFYMCAYNSHHSIILRLSFQHIQHDILTSAAPIISCNKCIFLVIKAVHTA